jgi:hypothetical protein
MQVLGGLGKNTQNGSADTRDVLEDVFILHYDLMFF